jgi:hypothetical protein
MKATETKKQETVEVIVEQNTERDEFADASFVDPNAKLPRIQALRGATADFCGYFVPVDQMAKAGWRDFDEKKLITYTFETSGEQEQGYFEKNPRMLVCPKTNCFAYSKKQSKESKSIVVVDYERENKDIDLKQYFHVYLLDEKNQPLHDVPLEYKAKGANRASFVAEWNKFCSELESCHALINRIPAKQKNNLFRSLGVFAFKTAREKVGKKGEEGWAIRVVDHERPTLQNWKDYFLGFSDLRHILWEAMEPQKILEIAPPKQQPQLPPYQSEQASLAAAEHF